MIVKGKIFLLFTGLLVILVYSCDKPLNNDKGRIIAETKDKVLLESELQKVYPYESIDPKDSIQFVSNYIVKWIKQQLLVSEAEKNLSAEDLDLHLELEKYRQELLIHKFRQLKSEQILNKNISANQIENYYNNNLHLFLLNNSVVQVKYIIFPNEVN
ncbi:MAG: hypothetical protein PF541_18555 [Prolixibacteraceae bacterium]|jgi:hypothetical protein|nr:hypothetical protein [Prolixibacteraceae bacterium]